MKFKVDENLPAEVADDLRAAGHDAMTVVDQGMAGTSDNAMLVRVAGEERVLLTMDKGIGNVLRYPPADFSGLVVFRPEQTGRGATLAFIRRALPSLLEIDLRGRLAVVSQAGIRIR